jgi:hypothetical protein
MTTFELGGKNETIWFQVEVAGETYGGCVNRSCTNVGGCLVTQPDEIMWDDAEPPNTEEVELQIQEDLANWLLCRAEDGEEED